MDFESPRLDNKYRQPYKLNNLKRAKMKELRDSEIEKHNRILLERMNHIHNARNSPMSLIMGTAPTTSHTKSMNHIRSKTYLNNSAIINNPSEASFLPSINIPTPNGSKKSLLSPIKNSLNFHVRQREVAKIE